jgi:radical SAM-linked protein
MYRLRVCYGKTGRLAFLGHLEVTGALERGVRRARLPVAYGQGFHPKAKLAFGPALPVGVAGEREYVDLQLTDWIAPQSAVDALAGALPAGFPVRNANYVAANAPSLAAAAAVVVYEVELLGLEPASVKGLERGVERMMEMPRISVERRSGTREYDMDRAVFRKPKVVADRETPTLELWLRMIDQAPVRPDALARLIAGEGEVAGWRHMRVTRMECYAEAGDGLAALSEAG